MRYSKDAEALELMAEAGHHVPAISERPTITGYEWLWEAFMALSSCHPVGMSLAPIPWTAVEQYAIAEQLDSEERYMLHHVITEMDKVYMNHINSKERHAN